MDRLHNIYWNKETTQFLLLFLITFLIVYFAPFELNQLFFLGVLFYAYKSKKDYFWVAFLFVLVEAPGRLFQGGDITDLKRIAFYPLIGGVTLHFTDLFMVLYIIKRLRSSFKEKSLLRSTVIFLIFYGVVVLLYSITIGTNNTNLFQSLRIILSWTLLLVIPFLLRTQDQLDNLNRLIFPFVFLALVSQFYTYVNGNYLGDQLKGVSLVNESLLLLTSNTTQTLRVGESSILILYATTQALIYIFSGRKVFPRPYLILLVVISTLSIFLSATRGWILGFSLLMSFVFLSIAESKKIILNGVIIALLTLSVLYFSFPLISIQINGVVNRLGTLTSLAEGDITAEGSLARLDVRGPRVMEKFYESPIVGWGFSDHFYEYNDPHVGHQSILLNVGVIGYILFNAIFFYWCFSILKIGKFSSWRGRNIPNRSKILFASLLAIYLIHSTSAQGLGFNISIAHIVFYSLTFMTANVMQKDLIKMRAE